EGADLYVASGAKGVVYRFDKATGKRTTFLKGQRHIVSMAADATYLYWYAEGTAEVRRTARKGGGKIEVVGRNIDNQPVVAHPSGIYWFEGGPGGTAVRVMRLAPGAAAAVPIAKDLHMPTGLTVDGSTVYVGDVMGRAIMRLPF